MLLAVDIGNTHIVIGCMDGTEIRHISRLVTDKVKTDSEYAVTINGLLAFQKIDPSEFDGAIISSVVPDVTTTVASAIKLVTGLTALVLGVGVKTGVNILIDDPAETGSDLVAASAGALKLYKPPIIIIDMGTATTIMALNEKGAFVGGAIVPGMILGLTALTNGTSLLHSIHLDAPKHAIGTNTIDCMKSGSVFATASMLDGMIDRMSDELKAKPVIVATGGIAPTVVPYCKHDIILNDDLLLYGLAVIYEKNKKD